MPLNFRPHTRRKPVVNITSLIDVLFLLLIFFMVSSTFAEHPAIQLDLPAAASAEAARADALTLSMTPRGDMFLDEQPITMDALGARLQAAVAENPDLSLILKADEAVPYGRVIAAIDTAKQAGVRRVTAFTEIPENPVPTGT